MACDIFNIFAIHSSLAYDVTTGHNMAAIMAAFLQLSNIKQDKKSRENAVSIFLFH